MEQVKTFQTNFIYLFLVLYGKICLGAFFICTAQKFTYISLGSLCTETIFLYNIHIDLSIIGIAVLIRIYYGSQFNDTFEDIREVSELWY